MEEKQIKTTVITAKRCLCNNNYAVDRYRNGKEACPGCDPELGTTVEERLKNYKILTSIPQITIKLDKDI